MHDLVVVAEPRPDHRTIEPETVCHPATGKERCRRAVDEFQELVDGFGGDVACFHLVNGAGSPRRIQGVADQDAR